MIGVKGLEHEHHSHELPLEGSAAVFPQEFSQSHNMRTSVRILCEAHPFVLQSFHARRVLPAMVSSVLCNKFAHARLEKFHKLFGSITVVLY